ncbi:MAG: type II secretion system protein [Opitutales bacterium]
MKKYYTKKGFTLIELLTVIAIIGILASILIPTVGKVRETARRTVDASNVRQIVQGGIIFASDNNERLPPSRIGTDGRTSSTGRVAQATIWTWAAALAQAGVLNDAELYVSGSDTRANSSNMSTILNRQRNAVHENFNNEELSVQAVAGLTMGHSSTVPVAFTRGLQTRNGQWADDAVYGTQGGHIGFLGGNVNFHRDLGASAADGELIGSNGERTNNILNTIVSGSGDGAPIIVGSQSSKIRSGQTFSGEVRNNR